MMGKKMFQSCKEFHRESTWVWISKPCASGNSVNCGKLNLLSQTCAKTSAKKSFLFTKLKRLRTHGNKRPLTP